MNILRKLISLIIIFIFIIYDVKINAYANQYIVNGGPVRVAVLLDDINALYIANFKESLEEIEKENKDKIEFTFFDAKLNQVIQNEDIIKALNENFDLFVIRPVIIKTEELESTFNRIIQKNIPLIIYAAPEPSLPKFLGNYNRGIVISSDIEQSGTLEGEILADLWNNNKSDIDKNKDNIMQFVMLQGQTNNPATVARTKYSIQEINNAGIKTEELIFIVCNWDKECAKSAIKSAFPNISNKVEAIISNNDAMAIGAIEVLQEYGFNKGDKSKYIPVVGIDAIPEARKLVDQGAMAGTVIQDTREHANAVYNIAINMISNKYPLEGTNYKFDYTGNRIIIPHHKYVKLNAR